MLGVPCARLTEVEVENLRLALSSPVEASLFCAIPTCVHWERRWSCNASVSGLRAQSKDAKSEQFFKNTSVKKSWSILLQPFRACCHVTPAASFDASPAELQYQRSSELFGEVPDCRRLKKRIAILTIEVTQLEILGSKHVRECPWRKECPHACTNVHVRIAMLHRPEWVRRKTAKHRMYHAKQSSRARLNNRRGLQRCAVHTSSISMLNLEPRPPCTRRSRSMVDPEIVHGHQLAMGKPRSQAPKSPSKVKPKTSKAAKAPVVCASKT